MNVIVIISDFKVYKPCTLKKNKNNSIPAQIINSMNFSPVPVIQKDEKSSPFIQLCLRFFCFQFPHPLKT